MNNHLQTHRYLLSYSIKPSMQRTAVMDFLLNNRIHPTIDDIYSQLSPNMPTLSKTTVYNTLNLFLEKGAVQVLNIDDKNARYDVDTSAHAHFICKKCGAALPSIGYTCKNCGAMMDMDQIKMQRKILIVEDEERIKAAVNFVREFAKCPDRTALTEPFIESLKLLADTVESQMEEVK